MRLLWKKSVSAVLTYFAPWSERIARPPKPSVRPRRSRIGNMIRSRKRSYSPPLRPRLSLRILFLALQLDPVAVGEQLHCLGEAEPLLLFDELDRVAAHPAAEAVVELLLRVDREGRRALLVEGAA